MLALVHAVVALASLWIGWVLAVDILLAVVWIGLGELAGWYVFPEGIWRLMVAPTPWDGSTAPSVSVPPPPDYLDMHLWSMTAAAVTTGLLLVGHWLVPLKTRIHSLTRNKAVRLDPSDPFVEDVVKPLAKRIGVRPPSVWVVQSEGINAFALAAPGRGAIVLTSGLGDALGQYIPWAIAHELAHLKHGDSLSRALWLAAVDALRLVGRTRVATLQSVSALAYRLPLVRVLAFPLTVFLSLLNITVQFAERLAAVIFKLLDRYFGRAMEYRADRTASEATSASIGIAALMQVSGRLESDFGGVFATHPRLADRIGRIATISQQRPAEGAIR